MTLAWWLLLVFAGRGATALECVAKNGSLLMGAGLEGLGKCTGSSCFRRTWQGVDYMGCDDDSPQGLCPSGKFDRSLWAGCLEFTQPSDQWDHKGIVCCCWRGASCNLDLVPSRQEPGTLRAWEDPTKRPDELRSANATTAVIDMLSKPLNSSTWSNRSSEPGRRNVAEATQGIQAIKAGLEKLVNATGLNVTLPPVPSLVPGTMRPTTAQVNPTLSVIRPGEVGRNLSFDNRTAFNKTKSSWLERGEAPYLAIASPSNSSSNRTHNATSSWLAGGDAPFQALANLTTTTTTTTTTARPGGNRSSWLEKGDDEARFLSAFFNASGPPTPPPRPAWIGGDVNPYAGLINATAAASRALNTTPDAAVTGISLTRNNSESSNGTIPSTWAPNVAGTSGTNAAGTTEAGENPTTQAPVEDAPSKAAALLWGPEASTIYMLIVCNVVTFGGICI